MRLLEAAQRSQRLLGFRALFDQLGANPAAIGKLVEPETAWDVLTRAEMRDAAKVAEVLMHPTVGVWLTRALHYTRPGSELPWSELSYLQSIAAAAAVRAGMRCAITVPVSYGIVSLPTLGHARLTGSFPIGSVDVICAGMDSRIRVDATTSIPLDGSAAAFTPARRHTTTSQDLTLRAWLDHHDPYHGFGHPRPPTELTPVEFAEWRKLVDEAWHVLTGNHGPYARELAAGLRMLVPIAPGSDTVGASSPAAFGAIQLSASNSAVEFAEALVHEMQHSKLNAVLALVKLTEGDISKHYLAPWRDDPRPLTGVLHGVYAFTCGVEFWLTEAMQEDSDAAFDIAYRRTQIRRALDTLDSDPHLTNAGKELVDIVSARLAACERAPINRALSKIVSVMVDDHKALWRLQHARPDIDTVEALAAAWRSDSAPPTWNDQTRIVTEDTRRLSANRRNLLRLKATDHEHFTHLVRGQGTLPGTTPFADAALCLDDVDSAADAYRKHLMTSPDDLQAWAGLGLACQAQGRYSAALLDHPEMTLAVHRRIRALTGQSPDPLALVAWLSPATAASCRCRRSP